MKKKKDTDLIKTKYNYLYVGSENGSLIIFFHGDEIEEKMLVNYLRKIGLLLKPVFRSRCG